MREELLKLQDNSYSPYSNFKVSCILVMNDGKKINGVNVENASYGATICAERNAITTAITQGYKKGDFKELYVMIDNDNLGTPCFMCRQVINEFFLENTKIICMNKSGEVKEYTVKELCPDPFGEEDLK